MMKILFALIFTALSLSACTSASLTEAQRTKIKNATVISAIGDELKQDRRAMFVAWEISGEKVDWGFDHIIQDTAAQSLGRRAPQINLISLPHDPNALSEKVFKLQGFEAMVDPARIAPDLRNIVGNNEVDTIILIAGGNEFANPICLFNIGMVTWSSLRDMAPTAMRVCLTTFVLDAKTLAVLSKRSVLSEDVYNLGGIFTPRQAAPFKSDFYLPMNEEQRDFTRPILERLLREAVDQSIERSGL